MSTSYLLGGGTLVTFERIFRADIRIQNGRVFEIGEGLKSKKHDVVLDCSGQYVYPGLINAHDHLSFNLFPLLGDPPYANAYEWGTGIQSRYKKIIEPIQQVPISLRLFWGAWKNLFSGVTTVAHHDPYFMPFRFGYPVTVAKGYTFAHSLGFEPDMSRALNRRKENIPFILHLAEGVDEQAAYEVTRLREMGGIDNRTVGVHAVGIQEGDIQTLHESNAALIWCPASNFFLFNRTSPVDSLRGKVRLAVGTDSTLTGSISLFDELRIAHKERSFSAKELFGMVTSLPGQILKLPEGIGTIQERARADLFLLRASDSDPYSVLLDAHPGDITALFRSGIPAFYDTSLDKQLHGGNIGSLILLNGKAKRVTSASFARKYETIKTLLGHYTYLN